jgi:uncharacterized membrane protein
MRCLAVLTTATLLCASAAQAELRVCNESGVPRSVAIGYSDNDVWTSEGWWGLAPQECKLVREAALTQRYIYWRATAQGQEFADEGFMFCVSDQPFTIVGDTECEARGYTRAGFRKADTGATGSTYTLTIAGDADPTEDYDLPANAATLTGPFPPGGDAFVRGQQGEPFTQSALMQSCELGEEMVCMLYAEGFRYAASAANAPAPEILDMLAQLGPNTPVKITGDILNYGDITAEVILSRIAPGPLDPYADLRAGVQGPWVSIEDASYTLRITGSEMEEAYQGEVNSAAMIVLADGCPDSPQTGEVAIAIYEFGDDPENARCWGIESVTDDFFSVFNLPRGNILEFRRP